MPVPRGAARRYVLCGALQLLVFLATRVRRRAGSSHRGLDWIVAGRGRARHSTCGRWSSAAGRSSACASCRSWPSGCSSAAGSPREFPVWSLAYFRFWLVKTLIRTNPLVLFAGIPLYVLYLRALGAKIGKGVTILSPHRARCAPTC